MGHGTDLIILLRLLLLLVAGLLWTWSVVLVLWLVWLPPTHAGQNTRSQVSQQSSSWQGGGEAGVGTPGNQHLAGVEAAGGDGLPLLPRHQVHQLVDHEGGWEGEEAAGGDPHQVPAYRAPAPHTGQCPR